MCGSCVKDLWAEWTWCICSQLSATGEPCLARFTADLLCWTVVGCVLALTKDSVFSTVYQRHQTQVRSNHFYYCLHYCLLHHVSFWRLEEFDCSSTDIDSYFERLHAFYRANNVRDSANVDVFLSVVGPKVYKLLKSLIAPTLPSDKTIDELYQTLKRHVQPMDSVISHRVRFYTRKQKDTESVTDFISELKLLAAECEFDAFLDQALSDIFAIGIADRESWEKRSNWLSPRR